MVPSGRLCAKQHKENPNVGNTALASRGNDLGKRGEEKYP